MRFKIAVIVCILFLFLFSGCSAENSGMEQAHALRSKLSSSAGCCFRANITADYGTEIYEFSLDCRTNREGNLSFSVIKPEGISGISGQVSAQGAKLTFDDKVLAFEPIADGQIAPVTAPWILIMTLNGGYLNGCAKDRNGYILTIDDSYRDDALRLNIRIGQDLLPQWAEIFWQNRRILTLTVENFTFL